MPRPSDNYAVAPRRACAAAGSSEVRVVVCKPAARIVAATARQMLLLPTDPPLLQSVTMCSLRKGRGTVATLTWNRCCALRLATESDGRPDLGSAPGCSGRDQMGARHLGTRSRTLSILFCWRSTSLSDRPLRLEPQFLCRQPESWITPRLLTRRMISSHS